MGIRYYPLPQSRDLVLEYTARFPPLECPPTRREPP